MTFRALSATGSDRDRWLDLWHEMPGREVFAHPAFVELFTSAGEDAICLTWQSSDLIVLMPMKLRNLATLSWASGISAFDLEGPYGYGGAYVHGTNRQQQATDYWRQVDEWARDTHVVTAFSRLSLFEDQCLAPDRGEVVTTQRNIVRSLSLTDSELWADYEHKVRKNVNKARRSGLTVTFDQTGQDLDSFVDIYLSTMDRRSAPSRYHFTKTFFETLLDSLPGQFTFAHVRNDERIVSTELVLLSADHGYSFLGGTLSDHFDARPNDLLKHEVTRWLRSQNRNAYILGGGFGGDDGIYRYKRSFAPNGSRDFRVWRYVVDASLSETLAKLRHERDAEWAPTTGYFPIYRG